MDEDGSGEIEFDEFLVLMSRQILNSDVTYDCEKAFDIWSVFFLFHLSGRCVPNFTTFRCLWPDWPSSRLRCLVLGVQATDETRSRLLSLGIRLSKGNG